MNKTSPHVVTINIYATCLDVALIELTPWEESDLLVAE